MLIYNDGGSRAGRVTRRGTGVLWLPCFVSAVAESSSKDEAADATEITVDMVRLSHVCIMLQHYSQYTMSLTHE
jgi:hypothetical protein